MARLEISVVLIGGSYLPENYTYKTRADALANDSLDQLRVCKEELNRFFVIRVGPYYPRHLILVFDTDRPEGDDYLSMFPSYNGTWSNLRLKPRELHESIVTYPEFDRFMNRHFFNRHVVYAWVEYPDESDK